MASATFSAKLQHRVVVLQTAADVVRFSFIVQNSISYLDLKLCQNSPVYNYFGNCCDCCVPKHFQSHFVNTEEKCRKFFTQSRNLLYTLHLDLPVGREFCLKVPKSVEIYRDASIPHIAKIIPSCGLLTSIVSDLIEEALKIKVSKLKILDWVLKLSFKSVPLFYFLKTRIVNKFIDCFYPVITDSVLFIGFIMQFDLIDWMSQYEKPEILEYMLYHARRNSRKDLEEGDGQIEHFVNSCLDRLRFSNIGPILKYIDVPIFTSDDYRLYWEYISSRSLYPTEKVLENAEILIKRERINHVLQIVWMYYISNQYGCAEPATEALRLIWSSYPDAFITLGEIEAVFGEVFSDEKLKNIYAFYAMAVDEFHEYIQPRSLQQLCRTTVRKVIRKNKHWIPEGINRTGLPKALQSFLNLEKLCFHL